MTGQMSGIVSSGLISFMSCFVCLACQARFWSTGKNVGSSTRADGVMMKFGSGITPHIPVHCKWETVSPALIPAAFGNVTRKLFHSDFLTFCSLYGNLSLNESTPESSVDPVTFLQFPRPFRPIACL